MTAITSRKRRKLFVTLAGAAVTLLFMFHNFRDVVGAESLNFSQQTHNVTLDQGGDSGKMVEHETEHQAVTTIPEDKATTTIPEDQAATTTPEDQATATSPEDGSAETGVNPAKYVAAIMDPEDTSFPRLECSSTVQPRYDYLKRTPTSTSKSSSATARGKIKYFFALDLYECSPLIPRLLGSVVQTIRFLGPENCAISVVEGRSKDGTLEILEAVRGDLEKMGVEYHLGTNGVDPKGGGNDRIRALADLRNQVLQPLVDSPEHYALNATVVFLNDISLCMDDILELIHQRVIQDADMTCAMDWIAGGELFYDVWVSRGINGDIFFEIPQNGEWAFAKNLFWNDPSTKQRLDSHLPFQVYACWNGATAFTATPVLQKKITFRASADGECYMGEPTLFCKDLWAHGYNKIAVVPSVNVGYNDEESRKVKARQGKVGDYVNSDSQEGPELIEWQREPPPMVKCLPEWGSPSWVAPV
ncbi:hypothetical protein GP486_002951 [Trichoglossum hirsutum]|uniref:Alpha-1,3-mannosyltransferase CMT1 n=1 Tax=Trichoglossum hirsutum TaxID=265104 RepID=A0A9P8LE90_9PEZI|nr:hypothetical protein GP486_002951 [Trichoglossum hirsutum]